MDVMNCYHILDLIDKSDKSDVSENQNANVKDYKSDVLENQNAYVKNLVNDFKNSLEPIIQNKKQRVLYSEEVLNGTFEAGVRHIPVDERVPTVKVNGETLLYLALSKYKGRKKRGKFRNRESSLPTRMKDQSFIERDCMITTDTCTNKEFINKEDAWKEIIKFLIDKFPKMITSPKRDKSTGKDVKDDKCKGYSPFYMAIVKKHADLLPLMIKKIQDTHDKVPPVKGSILERNSVILAGTPLGIAALTLDLRIIRIIQGLYTRLDDIQSLTENAKGDNIIHSMIKYFTKHPDKIEQGKTMLSYLLDADSWVKTKHADDALRTLLMSKNKEHLTPLQLAAKRQQFDFFEMILKSKSYCKSTFDDGLTTEEVYDITELETIPVEENNKGSSDENFQKVNHFSVLEFMYLQQMQIAFRFASCRPVRVIIKEKWLKYQSGFYLWFVMHLVAMSLLTWAAVERSSLQFQFDNSSGTNTLRSLNPVRNNARSLGLSILGFLIGVGVIFLHSIWRYIVFWCCCKRFGARIKADFLPNWWRIISALPYTNQVFEWFFVLFAVFLILDFPLAYTIEEYENYCLVFAVVIGWYLVLFFLQVFRRFSFFTVLIQRVMKDMFNFAIVMVFLLIGFTVAMYVIMQGAKSADDDFSSFWRTLLKMFTVMLGIGDFNDLFNARQPLMASFIFVVFVLLTTILLLNALIAMMSNSCTELTSADCGFIKANKLHETLQKLSVIIFLESFLPKFVCQSAGQITDGNRRTIDIRLNETVSNDEDTNHSNFVTHSFQTVVDFITKKGQKKKQRKKKKRNAIATATLDRSILSVRPATLDITHHTDWELQNQ